MAFTEERIFALIHAGQSLLSLLHQQQAWLKQLANEPPLDQDTQEPDIWLLLSEIRDAAIRFPIPHVHVVTLVEEATKRKEAHKKAQKMKLYMQGKRALERGEGYVGNTDAAKLEVILRQLHEQDEAARPTTKPPSRLFSQPTVQSITPRTKGQPAIIPPREFTAEELEGVVKPEDVNLDSLGTEE